MQTRYFEKLGLSFSTFGIGFMRFPYNKTDDGREVIDESISTPVIRHAIDSGVNYVDTAYVYSGGRMNEIALGHALKDGYRERVYVATKLPSWSCETREDMDRILSESLEDLDTDYIDFYLIHALSRSSFAKMKDLGVFDFLDKAKASGKIRYAGFSFHDDYDAFCEIIDSYDWDMCQIQFNFLDPDYQAGIKGLRYAGKKGIPVMIMEGLFGGKLAYAADEVRNIYDSFSVKRSPVEWAFRWICNNPEVAVVLSGITSMEQCNDNLAIFNRCTANVMTAEETELMDKVRNAYNKLTKVNCTGCRYCKDCPNNVNISRIFRAWNNFSMYGRSPHGSPEFYKYLIEEGQDASRCAECGLCEQNCPQHLPIIELLKAADRELREPNK